MTALTLNRLTRRELDAMIDVVVGNKPLPANIRQDIVERTDGIPLFVEEVTKAVLEAESDGDAEPSRVGPGRCLRRGTLGGRMRSAFEIGAVVFLFEFALSKIFASGRMAFERGRELTENPHAAGSRARGFWAGGWHHAKRRTFIAQRSR